MNYDLRNLNFKEMLGNVKAFVFDIDGVLSDSVANIDEKGELIRTSNVKDGYALQYALKKGFPIGILSGAYNYGAIKRFEKLGITEIIVKSKRKVTDLDAFIRKNGLKHKDILYMGDDIPDYEAMEKVGLPCCPNDAANEIKEISVYVSKFDGGRGCVRDIIEQVLRAQEKWMGDDSFAT